MPKGPLLKELSRYEIGTYADVIYRNALLFPDREAFVYGDQRVTFAEYNARINRLVSALQGRGLKKGDVLGILAWNCLEVVDVLGASMKGGFISSPFNPRLKENELEQIINYSEAEILFVGPELVEIVNSLKPRLTRVRCLVSLEGPAPGMDSYSDLQVFGGSDEPEVHLTEDDSAGIIYTSGTTGLPRGALYSHRRFMEDTRNLIMDLELEPGQKHLQITPLFHIAGNAFFRTFLYTAGSNIILKFFDPTAALEAIQRERTTHTLFVPTQLIAMLALPDLDRYDTSSMKVMWYGASPMPVEVLKKGMQAFGPIFAQGYGQSESGPGVSHLSIEEHDVLNGPEHAQKRLLSVGRPDVGVQVRIVDEKGCDVDCGEIGEIIVRSRQVMLEYWRRPEDTDETVIDGWLHTGDMGCYDDGGYIYIVDRKKEMIITGGENVYPREIEDVLYRHPGVQEAAVIGVTDPYWVEKVLAVVVRRKGETIDAAGLDGFCRQNLAAYKVPKTIEFVDALPKNPAGKIMKRELKRVFQKPELSPGDTP